MNKEQKGLVVELILIGLSKQKFNDWYTTGAFDKWISGSDAAQDEEETQAQENAIRKDIEKLFNL